MPSSMSQRKTSYDNTKIDNLYREIADKKGVTPGQLTLAWVLAQGEDFIAIPGTKKTK
jgi:aryl-alcohol dehydrogenase-like predicted oxidoreductase